MRCFDKRNEKKSQLFLAIWTIFCTIFAKNNVRIGIYAKNQVGSKNLRQIVNRRWWSAVVPLLKCTMAAHVSVVRKWKEEDDRKRKKKERIEKMEFYQNYVILTSLAFGE